jgi:NAD(P)-dependent dehydrogenase (short-subunit alcohol dehydrogenase family)
MSTQERNFVGKVVLVTGSSSGAGAEIARTFARMGAAVAVHCRGAIAAAETVVAGITAAGGEAAAFRGDLASADYCLALVSDVERRLGPVDILVNNAGPYTDAPFRSLPPTDWDAIMAVNVKAPYLLAQRVVGGMESRGWGRIVNVSATSAFVRTHSVYGLAKAALIHLTEALAVEFAPTVTVNAIAPGQIASDRTDTMPVYKASVMADTPMGRLVTEQEVARMAALLCSPQFDLVTGHTIVIDGGRSIPRISAIGPELANIL